MVVIIAQKKCPEIGMANDSMTMADWYPQEAILVSLGLGISRLCAAELRNLLLRVMLGLFICYSNFPLDAVTTHNLASYGIVFDGKQNTACSMSRGSTVLSCTGGVFGRADAGKTISVKNADANNRRRL